MNGPTVSVIQMTSAPDVAENLAKAGALLHRAKAEGAELAVLPENVSCLARTPEIKKREAAPEETHAAVTHFAALARELGLWLVAGSVGITAVAGKVYNRCLVFAPDGKVAARYDKIHLFDADPLPGESYRESAEVVPGEKAVVVHTPWGGLGLTICYDVRFASLFRALAKAGAGMVAVPAAFAETTGKKHWHVLLRARAIETGAYILAAAQCGVHEGARRTYGHSMVVAPSGEIMGELGQAEGVLTFRLDMARVAEARAALPSLQHDRAFERPL